MATRRIFTSVTTAAVMAVVLAMPGLAAANTYWHQTNTEAGVKTYPEHFQSSKTREQVRAEAEAAVREGGHARFMGSNYPAAVKSEGAGKTRQQVVDEMMKETPAERNARQQALAG